MQANLTLSLLEIMFTKLFQIKKTGESELVKVPVNTCAVIFDEKGNALSSGVCSCYFKDHFTKEKGRIVALKRAIELLSLQKEERTKIWNAYHSQ